MRSLLFFNHFNDVFLCTKSFVNMCAKVHHQMRQTNSSPAHSHQEGQEEEVKDRWSSHSFFLSWLHSPLLSSSSSLTKSRSSPALDGITYFHAHSLLDYFDTTFESSIFMLHARIFLPPSTVLAPTIAPSVASY